MQQVLSSQPNVQTNISFSPGNPDLQSGLGGMFGELQKMMPQVMPGMTLQAGVYLTLAAGIALFGLGIWELINSHRVQRGHRVEG
jgi:hypothetical protein